MASPAAAPARARARLPHHAGFGVGLAATFAMLVGASAPSPFYPVLQADLGYSQATSTIVFAIYAVALLVTLVNLGLLGIALKLYTEVFKELAQRGRAQRERRQRHRPRPHRAAAVHMTAAAEHR